MNNLLEPICAFKLFGIGYGKFYILEFWSGKMRQNPCIVRSKPDRRELPHILIGQHLQVEVRVDVVVIKKLKLTERL